MFYVLCSIPSSPSRFGAFIHPVTTKGFHMPSALPQSPTAPQRAIGPVCTDLQLHTGRYIINYAIRFLMAQGIDPLKLAEARRLTSCCAEFCTDPENTTYGLWFYASPDPLSCHSPLLVCERQPDGNWIVTQWNPKTYTPS